MPVEIASNITQYSSTGFSEKQCHLLKLLACAIAVVSLASGLASFATVAPGHIGGIAVISNAASTAKVVNHDQYQ